jgi:hypothetical protein
VAFRDPGSTAPSPLPTTGFEEFDPSCAPTTFNNFSFADVSQSIECTTVDTLDEQANNAKDAIILQGIADCFNSDASWHECNSVRHEVKFW